MKIIQIYNFFTIFVGLFDRKYGNGYHNTSKAIRILEIFVSDYDYSWNCCLYNCLWKQCCKYFQEILNLTIIFHKKIDLKIILNMYVYCRKVQLIQIWA